MREITNADLFALFHAHPIKPRHGSNWTLYACENHIGICDLLHRCDVIIRENKRLLRSASELLRRIYDDLFGAEDSEGQEHETRCGNNRSDT